MPSRENPLEGLPQEEQDLLRPLVQTTRTFWIAASIFFAVFLWGVFAYTQQIRYGLGTTGLSHPAYWGFYIINFVFFVGISHAGTLISAILRLCHAEWRRAITRSAEVITVLVTDRYFDFGRAVTGRLWAAKMAGGKAETAHGSRDGWLKRA
jgi:molybdopterin-containing oxidoreductase family membrane subunit